MEKTRLFQYAIIYDPTNDEAKEGKKPVLVKDVTTLLAKDEKSALILVSREIPQEYLDKLERLNIAIKPF